MFRHGMIGVARVVYVGRGKVCREGTERVEASVRVRYGKEGIVCRWFWNGWVRPRGEGRGRENQTGPLQLQRVGLIGLLWRVYLFHQDYI